MEEDEMGPEHMARGEAEYRRVTAAEAHAEAIALARAAIASMAADAIYFADQRAAQCRRAVSS